MSALQMRLQKKKIGIKPRLPRRRRDFSPVSWQKFFDQYIDVSIENGVFRIYTTKVPESKDALRIFTLHGGGYSALSWAPFAVQVTSMIECQVVAMDLRGHGETKTPDSEDLSMETLVRDVEQVIQELFREGVPPLLLVGHSMGGAVAVRVAEQPSVASYIHGLAVIDVVEGTAMDSLASMQSFLRSRPSYFKTVNDAVEWCVRSGQVRNAESARVSMPSQIINVKTGLLATNEVPGYVPGARPTEEEEDDDEARHLLPDRIAEEEEDELNAAASTEAGESAEADESASLPGLPGIAEEGGSPPRAVVPEIHVLAATPPRGRVLHAQAAPTPPHNAPEESAQYTDEAAAARADAEAGPSSSQFLHPEVNQPAEEDLGPKAKKVATAPPAQEQPQDQAQALPEPPASPRSARGLGWPPRSPERPLQIGDGICRPPCEPQRYTWRINLAATERHWAGWFRGLSGAFLAVRLPKLLLLATINGLDRELIVGQMQGRFQLCVLPRCGHAVHEDNPHEVARAIAAFALRHRLTTMTKLGETLHLTGNPDPDVDPAPPRARSPVALLVRRLTSVF